MSYELNLKVYVQSRSYFIYLEPTSLAVVKFHLLLFSILSAITVISFTSTYIIIPILQFCFFLNSPRVFFSGVLS